MRSTTTPSSDAILVLDIGNSRMKWARLVDGVLVDHGAASYTVAQVPKLLNRKFNTAKPPRRVVASSVGKAAAKDALSQWVTENWALQVEYVAVEQDAWGVTCAYRDYDTFGEDRWLALIAAHKKCKGPVCVVDCGTALTVDALASDGKHLGGLIVPGIGLMRRTLSRGTERIGKMPKNGTMSAAAQNTWLGRSAQEGVMAGTMWAAVAFIDRVVADLEAELHRHVTCILAGGDAQAVCPLLTREAICEPHLVLQGLAIVAGNVSVGNAVVGNTDDSSKT
uniref:Type III pantothenate kinase n=1 Tax=Candidatus Kentrum sp. FM TaxID=2126340 RepID=A0A450W056_9GAMM|nr:MAG: type III pantothenate kinase [Candidatus Kentron sp. FM]VFJ55364.1 MAG: type III pantothenate kinase [Candidatus Kentron sp. FM]VFK10410.1 MAG: type III pantothenate kinase [Candidatus Kentron sp. FM]